MKSSNFVRAQLSCCRNEKLMTLFFFFLAFSLFAFFCWNLGAQANGCYYVLRVIYSGRKEANCPLRVTIAGITESKYHLPQVPAIPHFVAAAMWISLCRLPHQTGFLLHGLQKLKHRAADRQVMCCLAMLLMIAALRLININGNEELISGCYLQVGWAICIQFLALLQKSF